MQLSGDPVTTARAPEQAQRLHRAVTELVRRYRFRDRNEICCFGISVSQCHALETLGEAGELTMGELASQMHLSVSTMTRVVDQLVTHGFARRGESGEDRRVCCVKPTSRGRELLARISSELLGSETAILDRIPVEHRESVIRALEDLSRAVDEWRGVEPRQGGNCCAESPDG